MVVSVKEKDEEWLTPVSSWFVVLVVDSPNER